MMNKKTNIENWDRRFPFTVPENYFSELKEGIQFQCLDKERSSFISIFKLQFITPALSVIFVLTFLFVTNNTSENIVEDNTETNITNDDLLAYLQDIDEELIYEYVELEEESSEDDYLIDEYDYNELIYEL